MEKEYFVLDFVDNKITKKVLKKEQLVDFKRFGCFVVKDELKIASENKTITIEARIEHLREVLKRMKNKKNCENFCTNKKYSHSRRNNKNRMVCFKRKFKN